TEGKRKKQDADTQQDADGKQDPDNKHGDNEDKRKNKHKNRSPDSDAKRNKQQPPDGQPQAYAYQAWGGKAFLLFFPKKLF
ncbi:MAG: hypothetical protein IH914_04870, partial [candidate division Zixibacteria bacterium]|nr:hypothetical protein [candidate division Zixibacteria bacterium]